MERREWRRALRAGIGRAGLHFLRAGYEVVSGVGAVLEELNDARRGEAPDPATPTTNDRPVRIELE
jgi:hypothetical protein